MGRQSFAETDTPPKQNSAPLTARLRALIDQSDKALSTYASEDGELLAEALMADAVQVNASDIHLDPGVKRYRVRLRIDGELHDAAKLDLETGERVVNRLLTLGGLDPVQHFLPVEARWTQVLDERSVDVRLAGAPTLHGMKLTLRMLDARSGARRLSELGLHGPNKAQVEAWLERVGGLFAVAGPTGSGKTTTLYALLRELESPEQSIVSIEDPVEFSIPGVVQVQVDPEHGLGFAQGLRTMLRLDPDYVMLGEVRDARSAQVMMNAAVSGRAVLTSLHSRDAVGVVNNLRNWGVPNHEIVSALTVVVGQRLVRRLCPHCRTRGEVSQADRQWLEDREAQTPEQVWRAAGCNACRGRGYLGRVGIFETWVLRSEDYQDILSDKPVRAIRDRLREEGFRSMLDDGLEKVADGQTTLSELCQKLPASADEVDHGEVYCPIE